MYKYSIIFICLLLTGFQTLALRSNLKLEIISQGQASGHVADIYVVNQGDDRFSDFYGPFVVFSKEKYAPLWIDRFFIDLKPGKKTTIQVQGTTLISTLPIPPESQRLQKSIEWFSGEQLKIILPEDESDSLSGITPVDADQFAKVYLTYPGTNQLFLYRVEPFINPEYFSRFMLEAKDWINTTYRREKSENKIRTVLSGNPKLEEDFITQILTWTVSGLLTGDHFNQEDLYDQVVKKYLQATGGRRNKLPNKTAKALNKGSEDIWNVVLNIGSEAGLLMINDLHGKVRQRDFYSNYGFCVVGSNRQQLFVEDPSVCRLLGGAFQQVSQSEFTKMQVSGQSVTLSEVDNLIGLGDGFELRGKLDGTLDEISDLFVSVKNNSTFNYRVDLNKNSGKFNFRESTLYPGINEISLDAKSTDGNRIPLLKSVLTIERDTIRMVQGGSITIDKRSIFLRSIRSGSIVLYDGSISYPILYGSDFAFNGAEISLYKLDRQGGNATLIIKRKVCGGVSMFEEKQASPLMGDELEMTIQNALLESHGYKGVILPPDLSVRLPGKQVLGIISGFKVSPNIIVCGWQLTESLDEVWRDQLSKSLMGIIIGFKEKDKGQLNNLEVLYVDTLSRQLISTMKSYKVAGKKQWPRNKLINPDYILDGDMRFGCCDTRGQGVCENTAIKVELNVRLIEAKTGRVVTTFSRGLGRRSVENDLICLDSYTKNDPETRNRILQKFSEDAVVFFSNYMARRW